MSKKLYIGNLSFSVRDEELSNAFASFGTIVSARVVMDRDTGRSKGFGFVEFDSDDAGQNAIESMNGKELSGRPINVSEARPQTDRPRGGGFRGGNGGGPRGGGRDGGGRGPKY